MLHRSVAVANSAVALVSPGVQPDLFRHNVSVVSGSARQSFGRGQIIRRHPKYETYWAGSDPRADGCARPLIDKRQRCKNNDSLSFPFSLLCNRNMVGRRSDGKELETLYGSLLPVGISIVPFCVMQSA
jgi:hypothetical protein